MHANLSKSPAYGMNTELTMPTYNKVFKLPFSFGPLLHLVLANWRAIVAYLMYAVSSSCIYPTANQSQDMDEASTCCLAAHYYCHRDGHLVDFCFRRKRDEQWEYELNN
jgi:hypothetical protein